MIEALHYRLATLADAARIAALQTESWRRTYRTNFRDEYLDGDIVSERQSVWGSRLGRPPVNQYVGVAEQGADIVGFVCAFGAHHPDWGSIIDNLHVEARAQRRGIGRALMREAGTWLSSVFPEDRVYLLVWERNPAKTLYVRLGGRHAGLVEVDNPGGGVGRYLRYMWDRPSQLTV